MEDLSFIENRVTVAEFGSLPGSSPLLVVVPTTVGRPPQRLHHVVARAFNALASGASKKGFRLLVTSGWRPRRWTSRHAYETFLVQRYGSVNEGRRWLAFASPHETGLAFDLGCHGLTPDSRTAEVQRKTALYVWLRQEAYLYGFHPYKPEPWHWEMRIPLVDYGRGPSNDTCFAEDPACCEGLAEADLDACVRETKG